MREQDNKYCVAKSHRPTPWTPLIKPGGPPFLHHRCCYSRHLHYAWISNHRMASLQSCKIFRVGIGFFFIWKEFKQCSWFWTFKTMLLRKARRDSPEFHCGYVWALCCIPVVRVLNETICDEANAKIPLLHYSHDERERERERERDSFLLQLIFLKYFTWILAAVVLQKTKGNEPRLTEPKTTHSVRKSRYSYTALSTARADPNLSY